MRVGRLQGQEGGTPENGMGSDRQGPQVSEKCEQWAWVSAGRVRGVGPKLEQRPPRLCPSCPREASVRKVQAHPRQSRYCPTCPGAKGTAAGWAAERWAHRSGPAWSPGGLGWRPWAARWPLEGVGSAAVCAAGSRRQTAALACDGHPLTWLTSLAGVRWYCRAG